ncbi:MAG: hypothetical protein MUF15_14230, partial [Acidobacteria bacterium]|nr:hypothetical protein [Acidobacteriota bacterium]
GASKQNFFMIPAFILSLFYNLLKVPVKCCCHEIKNISHGQTRTNTDKTRYFHRLRARAAQQAPMKNCYENTFYIIVNYQLKRGSPTYFVYLCGKKKG